MVFSTYLFTLIAFELVTGQVFLSSPIQIDHYVWQHATTCNNSQPNVALGPSYGNSLLDCNGYYSATIEGVSSFSNSYVTFGLTADLSMWNMNVYARNGTLLYNLSDYIFAGGPYNSSMCACTNSSYSYSGGMCMRVSIPTYNVSFSTGFTGCSSSMPQVTQNYFGVCYSGAAYGVGGYNLAISDSFVCEYSCGRYCCYTAYCQGISFYGSCVNSSICGTSCLVGGNSRLRGVFTGTDCVCDQGGNCYMLQVPNDSSKLFSASNFYYSLFLSIFTILITNFI